ncbi:invasion associated locus B family protein [Rhodopila sp.]|uniref:invasion associated locus B family protein n=1 Tax=Rhodopila sp. TaxID=2480087 RepID=UPI003D0ABC74
MFVLPLLCVLPAAAQVRKPASSPHSASTASSPKQIGKFDDWTAATHPESGQLVCYAFTRAQSSNPALPGRGQVILTVTERASGRDTVALAAGFTYPANATVTVQVDQTGLEFYTYQTNAFARDGKAAVAALDKGARAIARSPGPKDASVTDSFSLKGFSAAYAAIVKACPPK